MITDLIRTFKSSFFMIQNMNAITVFQFRDLSSFDPEHMRYNWFLLHRVVGTEFVFM